ncbi:glycosyltransferase [Pedobacter alpinus]|uniref:Glycosyltransferase n=1 Tax=Pedobacter alpinus TaxID=1590643 RepID=A0ABW5TP74_9SPHI
MESGKSGGRSPQIEVEGDKGIESFDSEFSNILSEVGSRRWKVKNLEGRGNIKEKRFIFIIHNIVKVPANLPLRDRVYDGTLKLIFLSRIHHKKGIELLLEALALVDFPFQLSIVGEGDIEYVESLKLKVKNLGLEDCINWVGAVYGDEKFKLLAENDLFVLPSYNENFANVVIESLAVGTPVLISDKVGLAQFVVKNELGLTHQHDVDSLLKELQHFTHTQGLTFKTYKDFTSLASKYKLMYHVD